MSGHYGMRHRVPAVIAWSANDFCAVCKGGRFVSYRWRDGRLSGHGVMACPHSTDPRRAVPILSVPLRCDVPRSAAA